MVKMAPNWARIRGTVTGVDDTGDPSGFLEVTVRVTDIGSVPRTRNLLEQQPGDTVCVLMSPALVERLRIETGVRLEGDVRRADLDRTFINPKRVRVDDDSRPAAEAPAPSGGAPSGDAPSGDAPTAEKPAPDAARRPSKGRDV